MAGKPKVEVEITSEYSGLLGGLDKASKHVKAKAAEIEGHTEALSAIGPRFLAPFAALAGLVGGGAFLKGAVDETVQWTLESQKLARVLGISTEAASVYNLAIGDIHISQEDFLAANAKLVKTLSTNEDAFHRLGVETRGQDGRYRDSAAIMADVNVKLLEIKEGTERNVAAQKIFGKGWQDALRILKLTPEVIEEARAKAERLNLIVGADSVEATKAYRDSMNDLDDTVKAVKVGIGRELMPVLTALNNDLAETGPTAVSAIGNSLKGLWQGILVGRELFEKFIIYWDYGWQIAGVAASVAADQISAILSGKFAEAADNQRQLAMRLAPVVKAQTAALEQVENEYADKSAKLWGDVAAKKAKAVGGGKAFDGAHDSETALNKLKADLEREKYLYESSAAEKGQLLQFSKEQEAAWLADNIARYGLSAKEKHQADKMLYEARRAILKDTYEGELEGMRASLELYKHDADAKLALLETIAAKQIERFGPGSKEAGAAYKDILKLQQDAADQADQVLQLRRERKQARLEAELGLEQQYVEQQRANFEISAAEEIARLQALEDRRFALKRAALEQRLQLDSLEPAERSKVLNEIQALEDAHAAGMMATKIKLDAELQKTDGLAGAQAAIKAYLEQSQNDYAAWGNFVTSVFQGVESSVANGVRGILSGQMSLGQGFKAIWKGIVDTVLQAIAQMIAKWVVGAIAARIFGQQAGQGAAAQAVASQAAAAAGIFQAHAYIPFVGPAIAAGLVALMNGVLATNAATAKGIAGGLKAFAVGGVIDRPTLALMGEAGREVVAPEQDFKAWARGLVGMGANLNANVASGLADVQGYQAASGSFAAAANRSGRAAVASGQPFAGGAYNDFRGAMFLGSDAETKRLFSNAVKEASDRWAWEKD